MTRSWTPAATASATAAVSTRADALPANAWRRIGTSVARPSGTISANPTVESSGWPSS